VETGEGISVEAPLHQAKVELMKMPLLIAALKVAPG
jgi:hypothetical protein